MKEKEKENCVVKEVEVRRDDAYNYYANVLCRMFKLNPNINVGFSEVKLPINHNEVVSN